MEKRKQVNHERNSGKTFLRNRFCQTFKFVIDSTSTNLIVDAFQFFLDITELGMDEVFVAYFLIIKTDLNDRKIETIIGLNEFGEKGISFLQRGN